MPRTDLAEAGEGNETSSFINHNDDVQTNKDIENKLDITNDTSKLFLIGLHC